MESKFINMVKGQTVLFVPTYSMRSYETGKYDLSKDGNMARIISFINASDPLEVVVTIPFTEALESMDFTYRLDYDKQDHAFFYSVPGYGENARETRNSELLMYQVKGMSSLYDLIVVEQQTVATGLINDPDFDNDKLVYWCVASHIPDHEVWFVDEYKHIDRLIASNIPTVCANEKQVEWLGGNSFVDFFYDAAGTFKSTVFFPFRLSDPEYHFYDKFIPFMDDILESPEVACDILVTDPNSSINKLMLGHQRPLVVPSDHALYMAILKGKPIVPYFAEIDVIRHISIEEMVQAGCCVICYKNETYDRIPNVHMAEDDEEFKRLLKHAIETEVR